MCSTSSSGRASLAWCRIPAAAASSAVNARRASPIANWARTATASSEISTRPPRPRGSTTALRMSAATSASAREVSVTTTLRDSSGEITEKLGFSVVAAMSVTQPFSTAGSSASCWLFEKRCTSSMKSTVPRPCIASWSRALSMTPRTSRTPAVTADSSANTRPDA